MTKIIRNIVLCLFLSALPLRSALAEYTVWMNNYTPDSLDTTSKCTGFWWKNVCFPKNIKALPSHLTSKVFTINYDDGIKSGQTYTFESHFTAPAGDKGNYVKFTLKGDTIGSHFSSIDAFVNGQWSNLLNSQNSQDKVRPNVIGSKTYTDNNGKKYTISIIGIPGGGPYYQGIGSFHMKLDTNSP